MSDAIDNLFLVFCQDRRVVAWCGRRLRVDTACWRDTRLGEGNWSDLGRRTAWEGLDGDVDSKTRSFMADGAKIALDRFERTLGATVCTVLEYAFGILRDRDRGDQVRVGMMGMFSSPAGASDGGHWR
jgi:hypothetical protein